MEDLRDYFTRKTTCMTSVLLFCTPSPRGEKNSVSVDPFSEGRQSNLPRKCIGTHTLFALLSPRFMEWCFTTSTPGPSCSKLTLIIKYGKYADIFAEKNVSSFCICKSYSHFLSKHTCELDIVLTRTSNILTTNELVKLTMLWTTGPSTTVAEIKDYSKKRKKICGNVWLMLLQQKCRV